jgi:hypothetical protein
MEYFLFRNEDISVCLFVYSRLSNFSAIRRLSPLPVTVLQIQTYASHSWLLGVRVLFRANTDCDTGPRFIRSHPKDRHPHHTVGFEPGTQGSSDLCASALTTVHLDQSTKTFKNKYYELHTNNYISAVPLYLNPGVDPGIFQRECSTIKFGFQRKSFTINLRFQGMGFHP